MKFKTTFSFNFKNKINFLSLLLICGILLNTYASFSNSNLFAFFAEPDATISVSSTAVCKDESVTITFTGSGGLAPYIFTYEIDGVVQAETSPTTGNSINVILTGTTIGNITYKLTNVRDSNGDSEVITSQEETITVNAPPTVDFSFANNNVCSDETIQFTDLSTGAGVLMYSWNFGDGRTSALQNPSHAFTALGCATIDFNVVLTVTDENGCNSFHTEIVTVVEKPDIRFRDQLTGLSVFSNCGNTSSSSSDYELTVENISTSTCISSFLIDWGDGTSPTAATFPATHTYTSVGIFEMTIVATGNTGCQNEVNYEVKNISNPAGGFASPGATSNLCTPTEALVFGITNWGLNSLDTEYIVDFGDGSALEQFTQAQLEASVYYNTSNPENSLSFPTPHIYLEGTCSEVDGEYVATLTVQNACGSTDFTISNITILEPSEVRFDAVPEACVNENIVFDNQAIISDGANCIKLADFIWDFGDGTGINRFSVDTALDENHIYTTAGTYTVTLTIESFCTTETFTKEICIEPEITPVFSVDNEQGCVPLIVNTTNDTDQSQLCSTPVYGWTVDYTSDNCGTESNWIFTNGTDATSENPQFTFNTPGKYTLTQSTTTECGTETATKIIDVKKPPTASIQEIADVCGPATINPTAVVENCTTDTASLIYNWTFTGGSITGSNTLNPGSIEYTTPGIYTVTLQVTNDCGVSNIASQEFEIFETPIITNTNLTQEICSNQSTSEITLIASNSNTTYSWTATSSSGITGFLPNGNSNTIPSQILINPGNTPGTVTYTVTPTLDSCIGDAVAFVITVNPTPIISTQPTSSEICLNGTATLLEVAYQNGTGTPSYQWFSNTTNTNSGGTLIAGATSSSYNPPTDTVGTIYYYAEISFSSGGCLQIVSNTASVNVVPQITVSTVNGLQAVCEGGTANELEVTFSGGTGNATYQWFSNTSNTNIGGTLIAGETTSTFTPNAFSAAGDFYFYAEISLDGNGCTAASSTPFEINVLADPIIDTQAISLQELCQGATPTDLTITVSGGTTSVKTYQWYQNTTSNTSGGVAISGETSATYTPVTSTIGVFYYYVIVSQPESGCEVTSSISELIINEAPTFSTEPISSEICLNGTATLLEVAYQNGTGTPSYQWFSNTTNTNSGGALIAGATSSSYDPPTATVGIIYYYVEISFSSGGCSQIVSDIASVTVNEIPVISSAEITIYSEDTFNFNPNTIVGNTVPIGTQYTWSTPIINPVGSIIGASLEVNPQNQISQTLENTETFPVTVTYTITPATPECTGVTFTLEVTVNPNIQSNAVVIHNSCFESNDASISTYIVGGVPFDIGNPYLISWTGPNGFTSANANITNLEVGIYILTIEDKGGFSITEEFTITQPDVLSIMIDIEMNISCFEGNDGAIEVTVSGGTLPYTYNWITSDGSGIVLNTENQNALTAGTYTLEIIDENNCTISTDFILTQPEKLEIETIFKQDVLCFGDATGAIEINVFGGTLIETSPGIFDYLYNWSGPNSFTSTSKNINNLLAGTYAVAVTDNLNCTTNISVIINQSTEVEISYVKTDVTCNGDANGSIDITVTGGVAPYQISWSNLANGFSLSNLSADTYIATITDGNNCVDQVSITIIEPLFFIDPIVTSISCNGENDGTIDLNLTGGIAPFSLTWSDDASAGVQRNNLAAGTYTVLILDSDTYQCPIEETFIITNPPEIAISTIVTDAIDCDIVNSGSIDLETSGGSTPYSFLWNTNETTEDIENIPPGEYSVEITDANGCTITRQFNVFRATTLAILNEETTIVDCDLKTVSKQNEAIATGGYLPYTYTWSDGVVSGANDSIMTTTQSGSYTLTVTDANGCTESTSFLVDVPIIGAADFSYTSFALTTYDLLSIEDPIQFTNISTGSYSSVKWDFGDGSPTSNEENPVHTYEQVGSFNIVLTVEFDIGCTEIFERTITITKGYSLIHPTAFTPNDDGYNETIRPSYRGFTDLKMTIYDTWGTVVYSEEGIDLKGWNGFVGNKPAENGNYVMVVKGITFYEKEIIKSSPVTLLK